MRPVYVSATAQHVGKTTTTLGLLHACMQKGYDVTFLKPVGQEHVQLRGFRVDKDVRLVEAVLNRREKDPSRQSPVVIPRGFVHDYLHDRDPDPLQNRILESYDSLASEHELVVVEGTGHAGVGSCIDLSNAAVAHLIGAQVVIIAEGGVGRTLDEISLSLALYRQEKVKVLGVIANKVLLEKYEMVNTALNLGLKNLGTRLLGCIPYNAALTFPTVGQVAEAFKCKVLSGQNNLDGHVKRYVVAAMEPQHAISRIVDHCLMITPGDRVDNMLIAIGSHLIGEEGGAKIAGILLTGGMVPPPTIMQLLAKSGIPVLACEKDTYETTAGVRNKVFKIEPTDRIKIEAAEGLIEKYVDLEYILTCLCA